MYGRYLKSKRQYLFVPQGFMLKMSWKMRKYTSDNLSQILKDEFGDTLLQDVKKPLIIPATDIGNGGVHVFKSPYHNDFVRDKNIRIRDAVLASCSAPTFFDPHKVSRARNMNESAYSV